MLLELRNNRAFPTVFAIRKQPYKGIWEEDSSPDKEKAIKFFSYLDFMLSPSPQNPFKGYHEEERTRRVCKEVFGDEKFVVPSELILASISYKDDLEAMAEGYLALADAEALLQKTRKFLSDLDPGTKTPTGSLLLKPKEILLALKELPSAIEAVKKARKTVMEQLDVQDIKTTNQREPNRWEE